MGLTNIDSFSDLAGLNSEPEAGWQSVNDTVERWRTRRGIVRRHDGFRSPAIEEEDGARKYPFLLNRETLRTMIHAEGDNPNSPAIWRMIRAWPPVTGGFPTALTEAEAFAWGMPVPADPLKEPLRWREHPVVLAGLDPGFGGDDCCLALAWAGPLATGEIVIWSEPEVRRIPITAEQGAPPVTDQILDYCLPLFQTIGLNPVFFGVDDSGPQGTADAFASAWSPDLLRMSAGATASEEQVSARNEQTGAERYSDQVTESVFLIREYGQYRNLRNVPAAVLKQVTSREVKRRGGRLALVDKATYRKTTGAGSPNEMDAYAILLRVARLRLGLAPGSTVWTPWGPPDRTTYAGPEPAAWRPEVAAYLNNLSTSYR